MLPNSCRFSCLLRFCLLIFPPNKDLPAGIGASKDVEGVVEDVERRDSAEILVFEALKPACRRCALYVHVYVFEYMYMYMCMCMDVCVYVWVCVCV